MKLGLFGTIKLVYSMVTSEKEDQLEDVFNKHNVVKSEGEIRLHTSDGKVHVITVEDLLDLQIDRETIEDIEDENKKETLNLLPTDQCLPTGTETAK